LDVDRAPAVLGIIGVGRVEGDGDGVEALVVDRQAADRQRDLFGFCGCFWVLGRCFLLCV
jgi:hypothetical protein